MRSLIILLLFSGLLGIAPAGAQQAEKTLLWRISGNGMPRPSYLFGTLHLKAKKLFNFPDSLYTAIDNTEVFALEINPDSMSNMLTAYMERLVNKKDVAENVKKEKGYYMLSVNNVGGFAIPFDVKITYNDGSATSMHETPAIWKSNEKHLEIKITTNKKISSVELDGGIFLDYTPGDNVWNM